MPLTTAPIPAELRDEPDLDTRIAELDALIEEARRRARRRRRLYGCVIVAAIGAGAAAYGWGSTLGRSEADASPTAAPTHAGSAQSTAGPTSSQIAFLRVRGGRFDFRVELNVMNTDGTGRRVLTRNARNVPVPAWSPDARQLAFERRVDPGTFGGQCGTGCNIEIYAVNADGTGERNLTRNRAYDGTPVWSPDGTKIAFVSYRQRRPLFRKADIWVMDADGSNQRRLTTDVLGDFAPAWSPDGAQIVFQSYRDGNWNIYVMNADGSNQRRLTRGRMQEIQPAWSPDGRTILFVRSRNTTERHDSDVEIWAMSPDGTGQRNLTRHPVTDGWVGWPAWSPDGTKIVFVHGGGRPEIWVMNANGSGQRNLSGSPADFESPVWSADGRQIGFVSRRDGRPQIYVMNADGTGKRNLTPGIRSLRLGLAWSPSRSE